MIGLQGSIHFPDAENCIKWTFRIQILLTSTRQKKQKLSLFTSRSGRLPDLSIKSTPKAVIGIYKDRNDWIEVKRRLAKKSGIYLILYNIKKTEANKLYEEPEQQPLLSFQYFPKTLWWIRIFCL